MSTSCCSAQRCGLIVVVGLLCVCVLSQMLGMPGSLTDLLPHSGTVVTSVSEDITLTPLALEPGTSRLSRLPLLVQPALQLPVLVASVFHPPQNQS